jgi:hypothetical protein
MKELTVQQWFEEIDRGLEYRKKYGLEDSWNRLEALFYNVHDSQMNCGPNIIMSTGDALMSALSVPSPYVTVKARRSDYVPSARILESLYNSFIDDLDIPTEIERAVLNCYLFGRGFLKIGYDSEWGWDRDLEIKHAGQPTGLTYSQFGKDHDAIEYGKARAGMPWVSSCMPHDIIVPWGTFDFAYAPWVAHRVVRHVDEIKADPKYQARGLEPVMSMADFVSSYQTVMKPYRVGKADDISDRVTQSRNCEWCELWEIHDRRTGKVFVIATGHDKFIRNEQDLLQFDGNLPFVDISFVPRSRNFWTTPDAFYLEQVQAELSDITVQGQKHRRSRVPKFLYSEDAFEEAELDNLLSADVGGAIKVRGGKPLNEAVLALSPQADMGLMQEAQFVRRNSREMVGLSQNQVGEFDSSSRRTAMEASIVNQASTLRMDRRQAQVARAYKMIFEIVGPTVWTYWTMPKVVEIMGPDGQQRWVPMTGQQLRGDYRYSVGFSTGGGNETLASRRQQALQLLMTGLQNPLMDPVGLAQYVNYAFNDPEFSQIFKQGVLNGQGQASSLQQSGNGMQGAGMGGVRMGGSGDGSEGAPPEG